MSTGEFENLTYCGGVTCDGKASIGVRAPLDLGGRGGAGGDFFAKKYAMPERVGVEIGMQTETFTIFPPNETAIIGKNSSIKNLHT